MPITLNPACPLFGLRLGNKPLPELHIRRVIVAFGPAHQHVQLVVARERVRQREHLHGRVGVGRIFVVADFDANISIDRRR